MGDIERNSKELRERLSSLDADALVALVRKHNALYWEANAPEIDDPTFDVLVEALRKARPTSSALEEIGGAAGKDAAEPGVGPGDKRFGAVTHARPMLSLDKCYDDDA